jgi:hypothetical protein
LVISIVLFEPSGLSLKSYMMSGVRMAVVCRFSGFLLGAGDHTCSTGYRSVLSRKGLWSDWTGDSNCRINRSNDYGIKSSGGGRYQFRLSLLVRCSCCLGMYLLKPQLMAGERLAGDFSLCVPSSFLGIGLTRSWCNFGRSLSFNFRPFSETLTHEKLQPLFLQVLKHTWQVLLLHWQHLLAAPLSWPPY